MSSSEEKLPPQVTNLTHRFKKGEVHNPNGRPKGTKNGLRACLRAELKKTVNSKLLKVFKDAGIFLSEKDVAGAIAERLTQLAMSGDIGAIRTIFEQTEKPLKQTIGLEGGEDGAPVTFLLPPDPNKAPQEPAAATKKAAKKSSKASKS